MISIIVKHKGYNFKSTRSPLTYIVIDYNCTADIYANPYLYKYNYRNETYNNMILYFGYFIHIYVV